MKTRTALLFLAFLAPFTVMASDSEVPSEAEIRENALTVVKSYAHAIACTDDESGIWSFITLKPWEEYYGREEAEYAVLWNGDVGCLGGSGTSGIQLAIVKIGAGNSYYVDVWNSSPPAKFDFPSRAFESIVANTSDVIVLEAREYGPEDANCCPSLRVRYTLKRDEDGDWKLHQRQEI